MFETALPIRAQPKMFEPYNKKAPRKELLYPEPGSNRHGFPQVFETSASTNSAIRASGNVLWISTASANVENIIFYKLKNTKKYPEALE